MRGIFFKQFSSFFVCFLCLLSISAQNDSSSIAQKYSGNLIAYYDFDQLKGTALTDRSPRGAHSTISNEKNFWGKSGVFGNAGNFSNNVKVILGDTKKFSRGSELTVLMWILPNDISNKSTLISKRSYDNELNYYMMGIDKGKPYAALADGNFFTVTPKIKDIVQGEWSHIAMIIKDKKLSLLLNGQLFEELSLEQEGYNSISNISIGSDFEGEEGYFEGLIDEFMILNKALEHGEIKEEVNRSDILLLKNLTPETIRKDPKRFLASSFMINEGRGKVIKGEKEYLGNLSDGLESGWKYGFLNYSLFFNGLNNYISVDYNNDIDLTRSFSIMCWVKPEKFNSGRYFVYKGDPNNKNLFYSLGEDNGSLQGGLGNGIKSALIYKADVLKVQEWSHVGLIFDNKAKILKLLLNGKIIDKKTIDILPFTGKNKLYIGGHPELKNSFFEGEIADIQLYKVNLPDDVIQKFYEENAKKLADAKKERDEQIKIRTELKKSLQELNRLNELLGEEDKAFDIEGKEAEALTHVQNIIKEKLLTLEARKKTESDKLKELIVKRDLSIKDLNLCLDQLSQPAYKNQKEIIFSDKTDIKEILNLRSELAREIIELELLVKQKKKEVALKEDFAKRKIERLQKKITLDLKTLNDIYNEIGKPAYFLDENKLKNDIDNYSNDIVLLIEKAEAEKKQIISDLNSAVLIKRNEIATLYTKIKDIAKILEQPIPKEIDLTSPLADNIGKLLQLKEFYEKVIKDWNIILQQYQDISKNKLEETKINYKTEVKNIIQLIEMWKQIQEKSKVTSLLKPIIPKENPDNFNDFEIAISKLQILLKMKDDLQNDIRSIEEQYQESLKKEQLNLYSTLRKDFKNKRSKLLILNSELNIQEDWVFPTSDTKDLVNVNEMIALKIKEMDKKIVEREKMHTEKKKKEEEIRQNIIKQIDDTVINLNNILRKLKLPEYPKQNPNAGEENAFLIKFQEELKNRTSELENKEIQEKKIAVENKNKWNKIKENLNEVNKELNISLNDEQYDEKNAEALIKKLEEVLGANLKQLYIKRDNEKKTIFEELNRKRQSEADKVMKNEASIKEIYSKIHIINSQIGEKEISFDNFDWEKDEFLKTLIGYYQFEENMRLALSSSIEGEAIEVLGYDKKMFEQGRYNLGLKLNGINQAALIELKEKVDANYLSVLSWIKPLSLENKQPLFAISLEKTFNEYIAITLENSSVLIESKYRDKIEITDTGLLLNKDEWQHFAVILDKKYKKLLIYLNGQLQWNKRISYIPDVCGSFILGFIPNQENYFNGIFDELKLYSSSLNDDYIMKSGLEDNYISIAARLNSLNGQKSKIESLLISKQSELNKILDKKKVEEEKKQKELEVQLKELNDYRDKIGEAKETLQDFAAFEEEYKITIIKSRIRRAKKRYEEIMQEKEAERKALIEKINQEREKLKNLYSKLGKTGELFTNVEEGKEEVLLNEIRKSITVLDVEYQKQIKTQQEKLEYIKMEMKKVEEELIKISSQLKLSTPKIPDFKTGEEEKALSDYRSILDDYREKLKAKIIQDNKLFAENSSEIEKVWEQLIPVLQELNEKIQKPEYNIENSGKVLNDLKKQFEVKQKKLLEVREKEQKRFESAKKELEEKFSELKNIFNELNQPVSFVPDYGKENIYKSLSSCKELLKTKSSELKALKEKIKKEQQKIVSLLLDKYHEKLLELEKLNVELGTAEKIDENIEILETNEKTPYKYFKFDYIYKGFISDISHSIRVDASSAQYQKVENNKFYNSLFFNGQSTFLNFSLPSNEIKNMPISIGFYMKPQRFWNQKSLVSLKEVNSENGIDLFLDQSQLKLKQIYNGKVDIFALKVNAIINEWVHVLLSYNPQENTVQVFFNENPLPIERLKFSFNFDGEIRLGSFDGKNDFYQGELSELKIFLKIFTLNDIKNQSSVFEHDYKSNVIQILENKVKNFEELIDEKSKHLKSIKEKEEEERKLILSEIETLKAELAKLTNQEKIIFSVVIGEEKSALLKLKTMIDNAKADYEKRIKEEKLQLQKILQDIEKKKDIINSLVDELGKQKPLIEIKEGQEAQLLKVLNSQIQELSSELTIKKAKNSELTIELKKLHEKFGTKPEDIQLPDEKFKVFQINEFLLKEIEKIEKQIEIRAAEELQEKWKNQYKKYISIMEEMNLKPEEFKEPEFGKEFEALSMLADKINEAKHLLKEFNIKKAENIAKAQGQFDSLLGELKLAFRELGQAEETKIIFNTNAPDESLKELEILLTNKKHEVEKKRLEEAEGVKKIKETTEGLLKAIDESKIKIRQYVKELNIKDYILPTAFMDIKGLKDLKLYFKFDSLNDKHIVDTIGNSKNSFFSNFSQESKSEGKYGFSADLNGLDQFIQVNMIDEVIKAEQISFSLWIYPTRTTGKRNLLASFNDKTNSGFSVYIKDSVYEAYLFSGNTKLELKTLENVNRKTWGHIVFTLAKNGNVTLYVNAKKVASGILKSAYKDLFATSLIVGSDFKSLSDLFAGRLDELKIFTSNIEADKIQTAMEEQAMKSEVADIDLLKEEYTLLQDEAKKLLKSVEEKLKQDEALRLKKVQEINRLKDKITKIQEQMGLGHFMFTYDTGQEERAILKLNEILDEKNKELKIYEQKLSIKEKEFEQRARSIEEEVQDIQQKLGMKKIYKIELKKGLEEEILKKAEQYLQKSKDEYNDFIKKQKEEDLAVLRKEIFGRINKLNEDLEKLNLPAFQLPESFSGDEESILDQIKQKEQYVINLLEEQKQKEIAAKEVELKNELTKKYRSLTREIESLQKELNIVDIKTYDKKDDPAAKIYLNFDENRGTLVQDRTIYGTNQGKFIDNNFEWIENGMYNSGVKFKGNGGTLVIYESSSLNEIENFTALFWVKPLETEKLSRLFSIGQTPNIKLSLMVHNGRLIIGMGKDMLVDAGMSVKKDTWQHLALVLNKTKNNVLVYSDGILVSQIDYPEKFSKYSLLLNNAVYLGPQISDEYFEGMMDEFKLFSKALNEDEIKENQKEGIPKIDTTIENYSIHQIESLIVELREQYELLEKQKLEKDKYDLEKRNQLILENKILREAETRKNKRTFDLYVESINNMRNKLSLTPFSYEFPSSSEFELKVISDIKQVYDDLNNEIQKASYSPSMIKKSLASKPYDKDESIFCILNFDDKNAREIKDSSYAAQEVQFTSNFNKYIEENGLLNNALKIGDHGYLKISNNQKVSYNLNQSFQLWIKPEIKGALNIPIIKRGNFTLEIKDNFIRAQVGDEILHFNALNQINSLEWTKLNVVINEFASKIQIGLGNDNGYARTFTSKIVDPEGTIYIGGSPDRADRFIGQIDEVYIFHRILYSEDYVFPIIYNSSLNGKASELYPSSIVLNINADNADFMRIYQDGKISESKWERFRNDKILPVFIKDKLKRTQVLVIAELRNHYSDNVKEMKVDVILPEQQDIEIILPPKSAEITSR